MHASQIQGWGGFAAAGVAVALSLVGGRRERRRIDREEEAAARQLIAVFDLTPGPLLAPWDVVTVENHTSMHVTSLYVGARAARFSNEAGELQFWDATATRDIELLAPGGAVRLDLRWEPRDSGYTEVPPGQPQDLFDPTPVLNFRDGRGVRWERSGYGRPLRVNVARLTWKPNSWWRRYVTLRGYRRGIRRGYVES